jgi:SAM-dependent methyltransferase
MANEPGASEVGSREGEQLVRWVLARQPSWSGAVDLTIHPDDEMLEFLSAILGGHPVRGYVGYFTSALGILDVYDQLVRWRFGTWENVGSALDFASGFGRATRFTVQRLPPERLTIAEILPAAVAFQARQFGVHGLESATRAEDFEPGRRFDAIFVVSLFTHLPEPTFRAWLARLVALLEPGGMLAFTTHDVTLLPAEGRPADELVFRSTSESHALDPNDYGSTWVRPAFVARVAEELAPGCLFASFSRGLMNYQDLHVLVPNPPAGLARPPFVGLIEGCPDVLALRPDGTLHARGWAYDRGWGDPLAVARLLVDGEVVGEGRSFHPRADLAQVLEIPAEWTVGWEVEAQLDPRRAPTEIPLIVELETRSGRRRAVWTLNLESSLRLGAETTVRMLSDQLAEHRAAAQRSIDELEARIAAMEQSRFWKARNLWFAVKRRLGWTA